MKNKKEKLFGAAEKVLNVASTATGHIVDKGREKADNIALQNKLRKTNEQLGKLVYMLHKTGKTNQPLIDVYMNELDKLHADIDAKKMSSYEVRCPSCKTEVDKDAMFCSCCGYKFT